MLFTLFSSYVQFGESPLYAASFNGHQKCVELLIDAGASVNVPKEVSVVHTASYRIACNVRWCKFSYELPILIFRSLNNPTAQHSDVEHIVQGNVRTF